MVRQKTYTALVQQHQRERREWALERERLLDRIMLLADKPTLGDFVVPVAAVGEDGNEFVFDGYDDDNVVV